MTLAGRWDKHDEGVPWDDGGDVFEDGRGVGFRIHPALVLASMPELVRPVARFRSGDVDACPEDIDRLSAFEVEAKGVLRAAHYREVKRGSAK
ncbi:MAG: hypothetical protein AAF851_05675 [Myxococcota bacterium]